MEKNGKAGDESKRRDSGGDSARKQSPKKRRKVNHGTCIHERGLPHDGWLHPWVFPTAGVRHYAPIVLHRVFEVLIRKFVICSLCILPKICKFRPLLGYAIPDRYTAKDETRPHG